METIRILAEKLRSPDEETRRLAVIGLARYPLVEVTESIFFAMGDDSWRVRKEAIDAVLTAPVSAQVTEGLVTLLRSHDNAGLRNSAVEALGKSGTPVVPILCRHLDDGDHDVRRFIIDILGSIGAPGTVPLLTKALDDPDPNVCATAAENLGKIGDGASVPFLLQTLAKTDIWLRYSVLEALVRIGRPVPLEAIIPLLSENLLKKAVFECLGALGDSTVVPLLVEGLNEKMRNAREAAAGALVKLRERLPAHLAEGSVDAELKKLNGSPFVEGLLASLDTPDRSIKESLIKVLGIIGDDRAIGRLLREGRDERLRGICLQAFEGMDEACATSLTNLFPSAEKEERRFIAHVCGERRFQGCASLLREGMADADPALRRLSVVAAGRIGLTSLLEPIAALLGDAEAEVRESSVEALARFAQSVREPVFTIATGLASAELPEKRRDAAILFAALQDPERLSFLLKDEDARVRRSAALSLGELKARQYVGLLVMVLADEYADVRHAAADALGDIGGEEVLAPLLLALNDNDPWVKCAALKGLGRLGGDGALQGVVKMLDQANGPVLIAALEALAAISGDQACESLKKALDNPDEEVVKAALDILSRFGGEWLGEYREKLLSHPHWDVRSRFISVLVASWGKEALPYLQTVLKNESDDLVKGQIVEIMGRMQ